MLLPHMLVLHGAATLAALRESRSKSSRQRPLPQMHHHEREHVVALCPVPVAHLLLFACAAWRARPQASPHAWACHGSDLGGAAHEATIGHLQEVEVFEKVARNFETNYPALPDLSSLQKGLVKRGSEAASAYPELDRILRAEILR